MDNGTLQSARYATLGQAQNALSHQSVSAVQLHPLQLYLSPLNGTATGAVVSLRSEEGPEDKREKEKGGPEPLTY